MKNRFRSLFCSLISVLPTFVLGNVLVRPLRANNTFSPSIKTSLSKQENALDHKQLPSVGKVGTQHEIVLLDHGLYIEEPEHFRFYRCCSSCGTPLYNKLGNLKFEVPCALHWSCVSLFMLGTFRKQYCDFWVAMFLLDMEKLKSLCRSWGIAEVRNRRKSKHRDGSKLTLTDPHTTQNTTNMQRQQFSICRTVSKHSLP